jgi:hypothetical protein
MQSHTYPQDGQEEEVREGFDPDQTEPYDPERKHNLDYPFTVEEGQEGSDYAPAGSNEALEWERRDHTNSHGKDSNRSPEYGSFREEHNAWNDR